MMPKKGAPLPTGKKVAAVVIVVVVVVLVLIVIVVIIMPKWEGAPPPPALAQKLTSPYRHIFVDGDIYLWRSFNDRGL